MLRIAAYGWLLGALALAGCTEKPKLPDLEAIYQRTAAAEGDSRQRRPLIGVPGTLGSRLVDRASGRVIWGDSGSRGISADPEDPFEYKLIALPIARGDEPLTALTDTIAPAGILETAEAEVLGIPIDINVYGEALRVLSDGGFSVDRRPSGVDARDEARPEEQTTSRAATPTAVAVDPKIAAGQVDDDFDSFQFDYDWRRDLIETAHKFGDFLDRKRADVARARGVPPYKVRFDMLAHSMGSLVSRYFLMYGRADPSPDGPLPSVTWAGAEYFDRVVFVAPPNGGSVIAMDNLINGKEIGPLQPVYPAAMLGTHPAAYQLMPRARHRRVLMNGEPMDALYDPAFWQKMGWGLADPTADNQLQLIMPDEPDAGRRRVRALAHQARLLRRAKVFHQMMDNWAPPPAHLDLFLVVGGGFETPAVAEIDTEATSFRIIATEEGDGVVLRASALLDERMDGNLDTGFRSPLRFKTTLFLPDEHVELTRNRVFGDNLLFWLLEAPRGGNRLVQPQNAGLLANISDGRERTVAEPTQPAGLPQQGADR